MRNHANQEEWKETAIAAYGLADTARLLGLTYHLVVTNVPYLGREKQTPQLRQFCEKYNPLSKHDLATVFLERVLNLCAPSGDAFLVLPQYWLFLARYRNLRKELLQKYNWRILATLGPGAFETISGEVVNTCLISLGQCTTRTLYTEFLWIDATKGPTRISKERLLRAEIIATLSQKETARESRFRDWLPVGTWSTFTRKICVLLSRLGNERQRAVRV